MRPHDDPDVRRMLAVQAGDASEFQELYRKYAPQIVRYAMQFVGSQAKAEELAQDTFLQAFRSRKSYEPKARFSTWLFRIATNTCLSELRRPEHRGQTYSLDAPDPGGGRDGTSDLPDPSAGEGETTAAGRQLHGRLQSLLEQMPPQQRAALTLARVEGFSYEEVAVSLDCTVSSVKSLIHRATVTMRDGLKEFLPAGEE